MLETILDRVRASWRERGDLKGIARKDRRYVPHLLFFPPGAEKEWLGADPRFCAAFVEELAGASGLLKSFARVLLLRYPTQLSTFASLLEACGVWLESDTGFQTVVWRERHERFGVFSTEGPARVAHALLGTEAPSEGVCEAAGLTGEAETGGFGRAVHLRILQELRRRLERRTEPVDIERVLPLLLGKDRALKFSDLTGAVADTLLLPYGSQMPAPATKAILQQFLLTHLKDPRLFPAKWQRASGDARQIFLRWLVTGTLEDFFSLIGKDALLRHWEYRRAFWEAYLEKGFIDDAWVVLGEDAYRLARAELRNVSMTSGRLIGVEPRKSLLLMRIDSLVLAEWSHEGACRVWHAENPRCPELHSMHYERQDIIDNRPDYSQTHYGNENYTWQDELSRHIRSVTGRRVVPSEYRVLR